MKFTYNLYLAVIAANIAGHMEMNDVICVPDDEDLTRNIVKIVNEYNKENIGETSDMFDYAERRLTEIYGITV